jgi:hypothetical protein
MYRFYDRQSAIPWGEADPVDDAKTAPWTSPPPKEREIDLAYDKFETIDPAIVMPWSSPPAKDREHETLWGKEYFQRICEKWGQVLKYHISTGIGRFHRSFSKVAISFGDGSWPFSALGKVLVIS